MALCRAPLHRISHLPPVAVRLPGAGDGVTILEGDAEEAGVHLADEEVGGHGDSNRKGGEVLLEGDGDVAVAVTVDGADEDVIFLGFLGFLMVL